MKLPFGELLRPKSLDEVFGQEHITGKDKILRKIVEKNINCNMIFYGPPGIGKTTVAKIIADNNSAPIYTYNATYTKTEEIKNDISKYRDKIAISRPLVYIDEIQNFNKKQQQILLEYIENGSINFIGSTTENPYHYLYKALLSRCTVLEFKKISLGKIKENLLYAIDKISKEQPIKISSSAIDKIAFYASGDIRKSINLLELIIQLYGDDEILTIDDELIDQLNISKQLTYDMNSDEYYDLLSAFQKSIRGSDENAALHYLARAIKAGDIKPICRRILVIASEDIGLAYPNAASIVKNLVDTAMELGLPEARIPLASAVILLATAPKSNSSIIAIDKALNDIENGYISDIPAHLKDAHYSGASTLGRGNTYLYPHDFKNHYVKQQYLPDSIKDRIYYEPQDNKYETHVKIYKEKIQGRNN